MESNYEKMKRNMQTVFLEYDQEEMTTRFQLEADGEYLYFPFMGVPCRIGRQTGMVECRDLKGENYREADYNEAMTVYDLLCYSSKTAAPAGEFVSVRSLSGIQGSTPTSDSKGFFFRESAEFDRAPDKLRAAIARLGGAPVSGADIAGEIPVFGDLRVRVRFWHSDDEFDAQLQFQWDANVLQYMHYETVWFANGALVRYLCEEG